MAKFDLGAALQGGAASIFAGPGGVLTGAGLGGFGAFRGGGGGGGASFDINAELGRISQLFEAQRQAAFQQIEADFVAQRGRTAANLAARGTLRSPVSEASFGRLADARLQARATAAGQLAGQEAAFRGQALGQFSRLGEAAAIRRSQAAAARTGALASIGTSLLMAGLRSRGAGVGAPTPGSRAAVPSRGLQTIPISGGTQSFDPFSGTGPSRFGSGFPQGTEFADRDLFGTPIPDLLRRP